MTVDTRKNNYLKETKLLDYSNPLIQKLIHEKNWLTLNEKQKAISIYNYVKDDILFGYNKDDKIKASKVIKDGYGQCNTKGILLMALYRSVGIPCRIHGFLIDKKLQKGAMTGIVYKASPNKIFHSYVEAFINDKWYELEGFILDNRYLSSLQKKFNKSDNYFIGYGVASNNFLNPPVYFDCCNTYIQKEGIVYDFGLYDDPDTLLNEHGQNMNKLKNLMFRFIGRHLMNKNVKKIRNN